MSLPIRGLYSFNQLFQSYLPLLPQSFYFFHISSPFPFTPVYPPYTSIPYPFIRPSYSSLSSPVFFHLLFLHFISFLHTFTQSSLLSCLLSRHFFLTLPLPPLLLLRFVSSSFFHLSFSYLPLTFPSLTFPLRFPISSPFFQSSTSLPLSLWFDKTRAEKYIDFYVVPTTQLLAEKNCVWK